MQAESYYNTIKNQPFFFLEAPLEAMPQGRQMRIAHLGAFPQLARRFGADPWPILERHEIDPRAIEAPDRLIDSKAFTSLLEDCSMRFNEPLFGLKLAQIHEPDVYGCVIALCRSAATLRQALESFAAYIRVTHSSASVVELVEAQQTAELRWYVRSDLGAVQQANYHAALLIMKLLRQISGNHFRPSYVNLAVDVRHKHVAVLEENFRCRFYKTSGSYAIAFPREYLNQRVPSASRQLFNLLRGYLDKVKAGAETSLTERVTNHIRSTINSERCCAEQCAQKLGMAVRTLQTKLKESGQEFSKILEQQRIEMAQSYLSQQHLPLDDVAANLGYSETSSFSRAFKRWTGETPRQYRQRNETGTSP